MIVKAPKCTVAVQSLLFLSYYVSSSGIIPLPTKVAAIYDFKLSRPKRQFKTYLGVTPKYDLIDTVRIPPLGFSPSLLDVA